MTDPTATASPTFGAWAGARWDAFRTVLPGSLVALMIALASQLVSDHYGAPAMLLALLFGLALNFLSEVPRCAPGIAFSSKTLLRIGVALLGVRISADTIAALGVEVVGLVILGVVSVIGFGFAAARLFGFGPRFAFLSSGAVAICGASAAMAIAAVLPKDDKSDDRLVFTVVGVTVLSTVAMILYPPIISLFGYSDVTAGIFIGATIHDVAQVVGAGYSISEPAGDTATLVKLLRVVMLAPVVVIAALVVRRTTQADASGGRPPILPTFVAGFLILATLNTLGAIPEIVVMPLSDLSRWLLLTAIAAVGLKTKPGEVAKVGPAAAGMLVAETVFLALLVGVALLVLGL